jgi:hypothetical protein
MTETRITIGAALSAGILVVALVMQQQRLASARAEQTELQARLRDLAAQNVPATLQPPDASDIAARDRADLERLRAEAAALRAKIAEFSAQAQQVAAALPGHTPEGKTVEEVLRFRDPRDAGQATPEATIQTMLWAMLHGDTNRWSQIIVLDAGGDDVLLQKALEKFGKESADMRSDDKAAFLEKFEIHLVEEQPATNNDRWLVGETLQEDGTRESGNRILFRPTDTGWRCVINTNGDPVEEPIPGQP